MMNSFQYKNEAQRLIMAAIDKILSGNGNATHINYRADIDGLRAIAVGAVVIYHAFPKKLPGGFVGVDIFFIISGFLISTILFQGLDAGVFSIVDFYRRRIKRIFPALLTVLLFCLAFGWFFLLSDEYRQLGKHIAGGAGFISNILLLGEAGYFDASADAKPLLHLWSLAVEEQFYIFWPLILAFNWKKHWTFQAIVILALASFSINIFYIGNNQNAAFYSPLSRFWELMLGSLLAYILLYKPRLLEKYRNAQAFAGCALLLASVLLIDHTIQFPGWWALLPTCGTCLLIAAGPLAWVNKKVLSSKLLVWVGLISYPLYLWHWPIFSFLHIVVGGGQSSKMKLVAVFLSILLAWLTYRFIEKPLRTGVRIHQSMAILPAIMIMVGLAGYYCYMKDGLQGTGYRVVGKNEFSRHFDNSYPDWHYMKTQGMIEKNREQCNFYDLDKFFIGDATNVPRPSIPNECFERNKDGDKAVFLWGDSHAAQLYFGLRKNIPVDWQILQITTSDCTPGFQIHQPSKKNSCDQSNWFARQLLQKAKPDVVIIAQHSGQTIENFNQMAGHLKKMGVKRIIFAGPVPEWKMDLPRIVIRRFWEATPQRTFFGIDQSVIDRNNMLKAKFNTTGAVVFADLLGQFCNMDGCLVYLGNDRMNGLTTADYGHLTPVASDFVTRSLLAKLLVAGPSD